MDDPDFQDSVYSEVSAESISELFAGTSDVEDQVLHAFLSFYDENASIELHQIFLAVTPPEIFDVTRLLKYLCLIMGCRRFHLELVRVFVEYNPEIARVRNERDGSYLLHHACSVNVDLDTIQLLIELNPDALHIDDRFGMLPLHKALEWEDARIEIVELLLSHYPDAIRSGVEDDLLPLHVALEKHVSDEIVLTLIDRFPGGANIAAGFYRTIALHLACDSHFGSPPSQVVLQRLVQLYPEGVRTQCYYGALPFHFACWGPFASLEVVEYLFEQHPDGVKCRDSCGCFPLHRAARRAPLEVIQFLVEVYPSALRARGFRKSLPLHEASCGEGRRVEVVQLLIDRYEGAESHHGGLNVIDDIGRIPLHYAAFHFCPIGTDPMEQRHEALERHAGAVETLELLLERYPKGVHAADEEGFLPLHMACNCIHPCTECIRLLLEANLFTVLQKTKDGRTALQLAESLYRGDPGHYDCLTFLEEKQNEAVQTTRDAFRAFVDMKLGLPDLVIAEVWSFVKPDVW